MLTLRRSRKAFTLIEILVVVFIIGVLIAVLAPNLFGSKAKSEDRAAQQTLRTAVTAVRSYASESDSFKALATATNVTKLQYVEPNIDWKAGAATQTATNSRPVGYLASADGKVLTMTALGGDDLCWVVNVHLDNQPDSYGSVAATGTDLTTCTATAALVTSATARQFPDRP